MASDGKWKEHVCAFARKGEGKIALVIVPRFLTGLMQTTDEMPLGAQIWRDTNVILPDEIGESKFRNILAGEVMRVVEEDGKRRLPLGQIFSNFPVALLETGAVVP